MNILDADCTTQKNEPGTCVYLENCPVLNVLPRHPPNIQYIKKSNQPCGNYGRKFLVCCPKEDQKTPQEEKPQEEKPQEEKPKEEKSHELVISELAQKLPGKCGLSSAQRIFGGSETKVDSYPWSAVLL